MEDNRLHLRLMLLGEEHLLDGIHAAYGGAVGIAGGGIAGADALNPGDSTRELSVRGAYQLPLIGPGGTQNALKLQAGNYIAQPRVAVLTLRLRLKGLVAGGEDDTPHLNFPPFLLLVEVNCPGITGGAANLALLPQQEEALRGVNHEGGGHCLGEGNMNALGSRQIFVVVIKDVYRAVLQAGAAAGALLLINIPRFLPHGYPEVPGFTGDALHLGAGQDGNIRVPGALNKLGGQDAHGAVIGREGLVQLGHLAADSGALFYQVDLEARVRQVQGGLYSAHPSPDNHDGPYLTFNRNRDLSPTITAGHSFLSCPRPQRNITY